MMFPPPWRGTLFDFNGVLVDDEHLHLAGFRHVVRRLGIEVTDAEYTDRYLGFDDAGALRAMLADHGRGTTDAEIAALIEEKARFYLGRATAELRVFEGAREALGQAALAGPVGVVSGALRAEVELGLRVIGARDLVGFIVAAEDTTRCKPDPEGYAAGARRLEQHGVARGQIWALEDSVAGIQAAKSAGLSCAAVLHSYPREAVARAGADRIVETLAELLAGTS